MAGSKIVPMASAVATLEPQIAAKSVQETTVTSPSEPCRLPNQAEARSTSALATPPRRMNAAAITKSGSAIRVGELSSSIIFCATPISGWSLTKNRIEAETPSTRKIGMPAASRPKNIRRKSAAHIGLFAGRDGLVVQRPDRHGGGVVAEAEPIEPAEVAHRHEQAARGQRRIIDPHRERQARGAAISEAVRRPRDPDAEPCQAEAEGERNDAVENLDRALPARRQQAQHQV